MDALTPKKTKISRSYGNGTTSNGGIDAAYFLINNIIKINED